MQCRPDQSPPKCRRLADILEPLPLDRFLSDHFGQSPVYLKGTNGRFHDLLDWDGLARLLESHPLDNSRLRLIARGNDIPPERYMRILGGIARLDTGALSLLLDSGATLVVNHIDDIVPAIASITDDVADRLGARAVVNLYASWRTDPGFGPHWDHHDILVLQLAGAKKWSIHKPVCANPLQGEFHRLDEGSQPHSEEILEDGDVLYLPRGWIHSPIPAGEPSLHLTISITRPKGSSFLEWLVEELKADPEIRANIPFTTDAKAWKDWKKRIGAIVTGAIEGSAAERYVAHKDSQRGARPQLSFPDFGRLPAAEWQDSTVLRPASLHRVLVTETGDGATSIAALGRSWPCSAAVGGAIRKLSSTRPLTLGQLLEGLDEAHAAELLQQLSRLATVGVLSAN